MKQKTWKNHKKLAVGVLLALATGGACGFAEAKVYTTPITGVTEADTEYAEIAQDTIKYSQAINYYTLTEDSTIKIDGDKTMDLKSTFTGETYQVATGLTNLGTTTDGVTWVAQKAEKSDENYKLTIDVTAKSDAIGVGILGTSGANGSTNSRVLNLRPADELEINVKGAEGNTKKSYGIWRAVTDKVARILHIGNDTETTAFHIAVNVDNQYGGYGLALGTPEGFDAGATAFSNTSSIQIGTNNSNTDRRVDLDVKVSENQNATGVSDQSVGLYSNTGAVNIYGKVNLDVAGHGIMTAGVIGNNTTSALGRFLITQGGKIYVHPDADGPNRYAIYNVKGIVNFAAGQSGTTGCTPLQNVTQIDGDLYLGAGALQINVGILGSGAYLNGAIEEEAALGKNQKMHLYLANGGTWKNVATNASNLEKDTTLTLLDGANGVLHQTKDSGKVTISSLNSTCFNIGYDHDATDPTKILGGDVTITTATANSFVNIYTNYDENMNTEETQRAVLDALAKKLYYTQYATKKNLSGKVSIAEGLTQYSASKYYASLSFDESSGQGYLDGATEIIAPMDGVQTETDFTDYIDSNPIYITPYVEAGIYKNGTFTFTEDTTLTVDGNAPAVDHGSENSSGWTQRSAVYGGHYLPATVIDLDGHSMNISTEASGIVTGIFAAYDGVVEVNHPGVMTVNARSTNNGWVSAIAANVGGQVYIHNGGDDQEEKVLVLRATTESGNSTNGAVIKTKNGLNGVRSYVKVDGLVDIDASTMDGVGVCEGLSAVASTIEVGGGRISITASGDNPGVSDVEGAECLAIRAYGEFASDNYGIVNVNVLKDEDTSSGTATAAGTNPVQIVGDFATVGGEGTSGKINVGLNTEDSYWVGNYNFGSGWGVTSGDDGGLKLFMGNKAVWRGYTKYATTLKMDSGAEWEGYALANSEGVGIMDATIQNGAIWHANDTENATVLRNLTGGTTEDTAGYIEMTSTQDATIQNYAGNMNVLYAHEDNGEEVENYTAGNTIIVSAANGAHISLITDNTNVNMEDEERVAKVLNALAGKLYYSNYVKGEKNLSGTVKIADGLTASSTALQTGAISFSTATTGTQTAGQGFYDATPVKEQTITAFTTPITGVKANDTFYVNGGVLIDEGEHYVFTKDSNITADNTINIAKNVGHDVDINANDKTLTLKAGQYGIHLGEGVKTTIAAKTLHLDLSEMNNTAKTNLAAGAYVEKNAALTVTGDVTGTLASNYGNGSESNYHTALYSQGALTVNGNVTFTKDSGWGISHSGSSPAVGLRTSDGGKLTVNGLLDMTVDGIGITTGNTGGDVITVKGGNLVTSGKNSSGEEADTLAIHVQSGTVNFNMNDTATDAGDTKSTLYGDIAIECEQGYINLGLSTKDSKWTGVAVNDNNVSVSGINLYLKNGATWQNESVSLYPSLGTGGWFVESSLRTLSGGSSETTAGNIFMNDTKSLKIDNYSGYTNVYYAHTGNGEAATDYAAGNMIIKSAEKGSQISLITDNTGVDMTNEYSVTKVLNALAGKLYYSNYGNEESNLSGFVKIADGLTASSATLQTGEIEFQKDKGGQGKYKEDTLKPGYTYPDEQTETKFTTAITGDDETDYKYRQDGVKKEDEYVFTKNPTTITVDNDTASNGAVIDATENDITLKANDAALTVESKADEGTGITVAEGKTVSFEGKELTAKGTTTGAVTDGGNISVKGDFVATGSEKESGMGLNASDGGKVTVEGKTTATGDTAVNASGENTTIALKDEAVITGTSVGLSADEGATVTVEGKTTATGDMAVNASGEKTTIALKGDVEITGTSVAASAKDGATVTVTGGKATIAGALDADGGKLTVGDENGIEATSDLSVSNEGEMVIKVIGKDSTLTGGYQIKNGGKLTAYVQDGGTWTLKDYSTEAAGYGLRGANNEATEDFTLYGGLSEAKVGNIVMEKTEDQVVPEYSGYMNVYYAHTGNGEATTDYDAAGNFIIEKAKEGSHISLITDNNGVTYKEENVAKVLNALAGKLYYSNYYVNGERNLTGNVKLAEGLTSTSVVLQTGDISFKANDGQGQYVDGTMTPGFDSDSEDDEKDTSTITLGDYETFAMKGVRSAATTMFHAWRDNMQDTYRGADLADEDGIFAKVLGGKTESDVKGVHETNTYKGAQIGYDKAMKNGWHAGIAFDYRDGDSDYLLGGKGEDKLYSFGVYGVKTLADNSYFRIAAKVGHVSNKYDVYTEYRLNSLHGDYGVAAYGLTAEYGKTFASKSSYITPKLQLTWAHVGGKDYTGVTPNGATMDVYQDAYQSFVGRLGVEAGTKQAKGNFYGGLYLAHEFGGDINTRYFAKNGGWKSTAFSGSDTWVELVIGGHYNAGSRTQIYADFARDFSGDFEHQWKLDAGVRFSF